MQYNGLKLVRHNGHTVKTGANLGSKTFYSARGVWITRRVTLTHREFIAVKVLSERVPITRGELCVWLSDSKVDACNSLAG